ncbi:hypothetical protein HK105_205767 [Polyrhizophydium stewartii]|uniref:Uncharacterized protein n=1 Tax=Polyrhizophydium stewartii TaxID=2732419 RepID=A0ABR4N587_9FUNG
MASAASAKPKGSQDPSAIRLKEFAKKRASTIRTSTRPIVLDTEVAGNDAKVALDKRPSAVSSISINESVNNSIKAISLSLRVDSNPGMSFIEAVGTLSPEASALDHVALEPKSISTLELAQLLSASQSLKRQATQDNAPLATASLSAAAGDLAEVDETRDHSKPAASSVDDSSAGAAAPSGSAKFTGVATTNGREGAPESAPAAPGVPNLVAELELAGAVIDSGVTSLIDGLDDESSNADNDANGNDGAQKDAHCGDAADTTGRVYIDAPRIDASPKCQASDVARASASAAHIGSVSLDILPSVGEAAALPRNVSVKSNHDKISIVSDETSVGASILTAVQLNKHTTLPEPTADNAPADSSTGAVTLAGVQPAQASNIRTAMRRLKGSPLQSRDSLKRAAFDLGPAAEPSQNAAHHQEPASSDNQSKASSRQNLKFTDPFPPKTDEQTAIATPSAVQSALASTVDHDDSRRSEYISKPIATPGID